MLINYKPSYYSKVTLHSLVFDDGAGNGYWFPCDENGNLSEDLDEAAYRNYKLCMERKDEFWRANVIAKEECCFYVPASGQCACGNTIELVNEYAGACQCSSCGQWYNLFGQELLPPDQWEDE